MKSRNNFNPITSNQRIIEVAHFNQLWLTILYVISMTQPLFHHCRSIIRPTPVWGGAASPSPNLFGIVILRAHGRTIRAVDYLLAIFAIIDAGLSMHCGLEYVRPERCQLIHHLVSLLVTGSALFQTRFLPF